MLDYAEAVIVLNLCEWRSYLVSSSEVVKYLNSTDSFSEALWVLLIASLLTADWISCEGIRFWIPALKTALWVSLNFLVFWNNIQILFWNFGELECNFIGVLTPCLNRSQTRSIQADIWVVKSLKHLLTIDAGLIRSNDCLGLWESLKVRILAEDPRRKGSSGHDVLLKKGAFWWVIPALI